MGLIRGFPSIIDRSPFTFLWCILFPPFLGYVFLDDFDDTGFESDRYFWEDVFFCCPLVVTITRYFFHPLRPPLPLNELPLNALLFALSVLCPQASPVTLTH